MIRQVTCSQISIFWEAGLDFPGQSEEHREVGIFYFFSLVGNKKIIESGKKL